MGWAERESRLRVLWVALETLPGPALLPGRICDALGLASPLSSDALAHVLRALATEPTLLILDNAEHLLSPAGDFAGLVQELLCALPDLRVLVTSREALGVVNEQLYPLDGERQLFLGANTLGDEENVMRYRRDPDRNVLGLFDRIGPHRWRLAMPAPRWQSMLEVLELTPAG